MLQAAGHANTLKEDESEQGFILKPYDEAEAKNYEKLWAMEGDPLQKCVARWGGTTEMCRGTEGGETELFMRLGNLLEAFKDPCVMDCKMGCRTFQEKECKNQKLRPDLYKRLKELTPEMLSEEDHQAEGITKFKWMNSRDAASTSKPLAFRIDGIVSKQGARVAKKDLDLFGSKDQVLEALPRILPLYVSSAGSKQGIILQRIALVQQIIDELELVRSAMEGSKYFQRHEFVGASLLFVLDTHKAKVFFIDFAKTEPLPEGVSTSHRGEWVPGNHEDSLLKGVDNLIDCWKTNLLRLERSSSDGDRGRSDSDGARGNSPDINVDDARMQELEMKLQKYDVPVQSWGADGAKSLEELYSEIYDERASSFEIAEDGRLFRVMDVVKAWVLVDTLDRGTLALVEPKKHDKFAKEDLKDLSVGVMQGTVKGKPLQKKVSSDQTWEDTLSQGIMERLGIPHESQSDLFDMQRDTYKMSVDMRLGTLKDGFLGLWSKYRIHEVDVRVRDPQNPKLSCLGLPEGNVFVTVQAAGSHSAFGHRQHAWNWQSVDKAGYVARDSKGAAPAFSDDKALVKAVFKSVDAQNTGKLHRDVLREAFLNIFPTWPEQDHNDLFSSFEGDANGELDYNAFIDWLYDNNRKS